MPRPQARLNPDGCGSETQQARSRASEPISQQDKACGRDNPARRATVNAPKATLAFLPSKTTTVLGADPVDEAN
jgi:hypothetical protein